MKVWWRDATLFVYFDIIRITYIHSRYIHTVHSSVVIRRGSSPSPHSCMVSSEKPPWSAEPRIELGPAIQQADALSAELRRTETELYATPGY